MSRRHLTFRCAGALLAATLDDAPGRSAPTTGLLLVSGGNETRAGAFSGQAQLAARIAAAGFPVFRFDRRGVGDSEGENPGFLGSAADIAAALAAFRQAAPQLTRVVGFGNCDAASALMLGAGDGFDALVLANPWTIEGTGTAHSPQAVRARYAARLRSPKQLWRLLSGQVSLTRLARGIGQALKPPPPAGDLAQAVAVGLARFGGPAAILLSQSDRTAQAFEAVWNPGDPRVRRCAQAGHSFAEPAARDWLFDQLIAALQQSDRRA